MIGIILAGLGIVSPIAWDWWSKQSQLVVETVSSISVIGHSQSLKNLEFTYNGKKIAELQRLNVTIKNAGRTPIAKEDIVVPLTLTLRAGEVLEANIVRQVPTNLGGTIAVSKNSISIFFSLLNPNDEVEIEILTSGKFLGYVANARIKNIESVALGDSSRAITIRSDVGVGVYIAGIFGLVFLIGAIAMFLEIPTKTRAVASLKDGSHRLLNSSSQQEADRHLQSDFAFLTGSRNRLLRSSIANRSWPLDPSNSSALRNDVIGIVDSEPSAGPGAIAFVIAGAALWYVGTSVFG